jgi:hypothetical protein
VSPEGFGGGVGGASGRTGTAVAGGGNGRWTAIGSPLAMAGEPLEDALAVSLGDEVGVGVIGVTVGSAWEATARGVLGLGVESLDVVDAGAPEACVRAALTPQTIAPTTTSPRTPRPAKSGARDVVRATV